MDCSESKLSAGRESPGPSSEYKALEFPIITILERLFPRRQSYPAPHSGLEANLQYAGGVMLGLRTFGCGAIQADVAFMRGSGVGNSG